VSGDANDTTLESVTRYNLRERRELRDELRRVLAKIAERRITGKVEIDLSEGTPGKMLAREVVKETK
jgi:hypothetical protein